MVIAELEVPFVAAPMAGGPSTPDLVTAVAAAGGLGLLAGGYLSCEGLARDIAGVWDDGTTRFGVNLFVPAGANTARPPATPEHVRARVEAVRAYRERLLPEAGRRGVELPERPVAGDDDWERKLDLVVRERVPLVSFTFGLPGAAVLGELRRAGAVTMVTVTDPDEARAALEAGADTLWVQGPGAGGHRGTLHEDAVPGDLPLDELVARVRALTDVPIVAAGGLGDAATAARAITAGADAVGVGTALLLTPEAGTSLAHRRAVRAGGVTRVTRAFSGRPARSVENEFVRRYDDGAPTAYPEVHHLTVPLRRAAAAVDDPDGVAPWAGTGLAGAREVPAAAVVAAWRDELVAARDARTAAGRPASGGGGTVPSAEGALDWQPAGERTAWLAPPVAAALSLVPGARAAQIDATLADTAAFCEAYAVAPEASANCVVVEGRRGEEVTRAAVMVLATDRADVNKAVRRHLGVRKISFADQGTVESLTGMQRGGITPVGLPEGWPVLVDRAVASAGPVVVGAGARGAKLLLDGAELAALPGAVVIDLALRRGDAQGGDGRG
ncbi:nitronate monooxygenase [Terracoccus luteus]|uniref:Propionate 3-nitronate monooxygenase n=1 Tax=Terracoccus luteus TaxID=53356 RepID=A0A839PYT5_9MICO|nr:NAD(P)H-dependent flavin oxidoreductase YrpB (nitropropane dioxygenase family)/prolyl-tRNA editing enzyme YbaK/EbsC (Cys-tRNA(Pro) deacylase) [Terracoccus luteus]MCP2171594.1 NAD(P)H-dependent flavin oxidoreductase YrpB (nitropropane dioxygenase family)/prolyl-tRNA editing enzyme YbaK/EbsC (Cys-tRNA(Pro) deacylase) [Terracoccus luteus]